MKAVIQRVSSASISVDGVNVSEIESGLFILLGVNKDDRTEQADILVNKIANLRIFSDENDKMNLSAMDKNASILLVSQFTLSANCKSGRRPSFIEAARPEIAQPLYEYVGKSLEHQGLDVSYGVFGANMQIDSKCDGPVTIILDTNEL